VPARWATASPRSSPSCGVTTYLVDIKQEFLDRGIANVHKSLARFQEKGTLTADQVAGIKGRLHASTDMGVLGKVDLCVEAVTENLDVKTKVFQAADAALPAQAILASNTSSISITVLAAKTKRADRVIGMHFMNPVPLMKLVEVIRGNDTSDATCDGLTLVEGARQDPGAANDYPASSPTAS
jgi:3-hydroxybutyryl-CoA dehydrogenase